MNKLMKCGLYFAVLVGVALVSYRLGVERGRPENGLDELAAERGRPGDEEAVETGRAEARKEAEPEGGAEASSAAALLEVESKHARRHAFDQVLENLDTETARQLLAELDMQPASPRKRDMMLQLFSRWGQVDGELAYEQAKAMKGRDRLDYISEAAGGWAELDPLAAWEVMMIETNNGSMPRPSIGPVARQIAKANLGKAVKLLSACSSEMTAHAGFREVLGQVGDDGRYAELYGAVSAIEDSGMREKMSRDLFETWGRYSLSDPVGAIRAIDDPLIASSAMEGFLVGWASVEGKAAFDFAVENMTNPIVAENLSEVMVEWGKSASAEDLETILLQVQGSESESRDQILRDVLQPLARVDPRLAIDHALTIGNEGERATSVREVMSHWARANLEEAERYYYGMEDQPSQLKAIISLVDPMLKANADPERVYRLATTLEGDSEREQALLYMANIARLSKNRESSESFKQFISSEISDLEWLSPRAKFNIRRQLNH